MENVLLALLLKPAIYTDLFYQPWTKDKFKSLYELKFALDF